MPDDELIRNLTADKRTLSKLLHETQARIAALEAQLATANAAADAEMERVKACEHIAEGDEGWEALRNLCPSTAAVSRLRDAYQAIAAPVAAERLTLLQRDLRSATTTLRRLIKESHGG